MIRACLTSEAVPPEERFDWWFGLKSASPIATTLHSDFTDDFPVAVDHVDLGAATLTTMSYPSAEVRRTARHIRRGDPGSLQVSLTLQGLSGFEQAGRNVRFGAGNFLLYESSSPFEGWMRRGDESGGPTRSIVATLPLHLLPFPADRLGDIVSRPLSGREGFGSLLAHFMCQVVDDAGQFGDTTAAADRLTHTLVDLVGHLAAQHLDNERELPPESRTRTLLLQVQSHIRRHLRDPGLNPDSIAAAHHISTRYLHRLFQDQGLTVSSWIRRLRLERCRRALANPTLAAVPVGAIAARWGFAQPAVFTRAFRAAYGLTPSEVRARTLMSNGSALAVNNSAPMVKDVG
ncbi:helix-turn-helix domain-containing protein [Streptomyces sp. KL118A]|uniref:helix-turn-helix domain-containing protein n=2 Tax=Streptomyces TaxID=1883 RepID=UPI00278C42FD|nr:helix-turn-helix domain-containing protein [Streptomyces sp. KL118A]